MARSTEIKVKLDTEDLLKCISNACYGEVAFIVPGFPGEIRIKNATGEAPKIGQRVLVIPIDD
jgi:hypothetical protein